MRMPKFLWFKKNLCVGCRNVDRSVSIACNLLGMRGHCHQMFNWINDNNNILIGICTKYLSIYYLLSSNHLSHVMKIPITSRLRASLYRKLQFDVLMRSCPCMSYVILNISKYIWMYITMTSLSSLFFVLVVVGVDVVIVVVFLFALQMFILIHLIGFVQSFPTRMLALCTLSMNTRSVLILLSFNRISWCYVFAEWLWLWLLFTPLVSFIDVSNFLRTVTK